MATTAEQLAVLKRIRASGVVSLTRPDGGDVTYRSMAEVEQAIARLEGELATAAGTTPPRRLSVTLANGFE